MSNILNELNELAGDPERDALEKMQEELTVMRENSGKFVQLFKAYVQSTDKRFEKLETMLEIMKANRGGHTSVTLDNSKNTKAGDGAQINQGEVSNPGQENK